MNSKMPAQLWPLCLSLRVCINWTLINKFVSSSVPFYILSIRWYNVALLTQCFDVLTLISTTIFLWCSASQCPWNVNNQRRSIHSLITSRFGCLFQFTPTKQSTYCTFNSITSQFIIMYYYFIKKWDMLIDTVSIVLFQTALSTRRHIAIHKRFTVLF